MAKKELNLGILAHVDAGKTTLTERLLYEAGAIDELGSVDAGTTQTYSLTLERQRGITIKSAVASFALKDVHVNLIDTPGHPDFIAEVERVLSVLDGAILVISGVEGVQPQTRILVRALQRLCIPTHVLVNKIDRPGADDERVVQGISQRLTAAVVPMGTAHALGTRAAYFTCRAWRTPLSELDWPRCSRNATRGSWHRMSRTSRICHVTYCATRSWRRRSGRSCTLSSSVPRSPVRAWSR